MKLREGDDFALRRALRGLPRERAPQRDLWKGISARLPASTDAARPRARRRWIAAGLAAGLLVATLWGLAPGRLAEAPTHRAAQARGPAVSPLQREADALTLEYRLALVPLQGGNLPPALAATMEELDRSAMELRSAIDAQPEAPWLLDRLRHTYRQRLRLAQRLAAT